MTPIECKCARLIALTANEQEKRFVLVGKNGPTHFGLD